MEEREDKRLESQRRDKSRDIRRHVYNVCQLFKFIICFIVKICSNNIEIMYVKFICIKFEFAF